MPIEDCEEAIMVLLIEAIFNQKLYMKNWKSDKEIKVGLFSSQIILLLKYLTEIKAMIYRLSKLTLSS